MANSDKRIVYTNSEGRVCVLVPADNCDLTVEQIAAKDVPTDSKYKIVDKGDVPTDRSFRDSWTCDESDLTDGVGS